MNMKETKHCPDCKRDLPRSAFYSKGKSKANGRNYLTTQCKECIRKSRRSNRVEENQRRHEWLSRGGRQVINQYMRKWRQKHPHYKEHQKITYREYNSRSGRGRINRKDWQNIIDAFGNTCVYCGKPEKLEVDHFIPQSLGGRNDFTNFVPACRRCNASKGNLHPSIFLSPERYTYILSILSLIT